MQVLHPINNTRKAVSRQGEIYRHFPQPIDHWQVRDVK
jgi:hypothetical protein